MRGAGQGPKAVQSREADWQAKLTFLYLCYNTRAYRGGVMGWCTIRWGNGHCPGPFASWRGQWRLASANGTLSGRQARWLLPLAPGGNSSTTRVHELVSLCSAASFRSVVRWAQQGSGALRRGARVALAEVVQIELDRSKMLARGVSVSSPWKIHSNLLIR